MNRAGSIAACVTIVVLGALERLIESGEQLYDRSAKPTDVQPPAVLPRKQTLELGHVERHDQYMAIWWNERYCGDADITFAAYRMSEVIW